MGLLNQISKTGNRIFENSPAAENPKNEIIENPPIPIPTTTAPLIPEIDPPGSPTCDVPLCECQIYFFDIFDGIWKCGKHRKNELSPAARRNLKTYDFREVLTANDFQKPFADLTNSASKSTNHTPPRVPGIPQCPVPACDCHIHWQDGYGGFHCGEHSPWPSRSLAAKIVHLVDALAEHEQSKHPYGQDQPRRPGQIIGVDEASESWWTNNLTFQITTRATNTGDQNVDRKIKESIDREQRKCQSKRTMFWLRNFERPNVSLPNMEGA